MLYEGLRSVSRVSWNTALRIGRRLTMKVRGRTVTLSVVSRLRAAVKLAKHFVDGVDDCLRLIQLNVVF